MYQRLSSWIHRLPYGHHAAQFIKFCIIGTSGLVIDFSVLNLLSTATSIYAGPFIALFNAVSFSVAVSNSYYWNRRWTFRHQGPVSASSVSRFMLVNAGGAFLNSAIVFILTTFVPPLFAVHPQLWLNAAKIIALPISTFWNFLGAKYFIFRAEQQELV